MVIEVVTWPRSMPSKSASMSSIESTATPQRPTSPSDSRLVGVPSHQGRHVEGDRQAGLALLQEEPVALVGLRGDPNPANCRMVHILPRYMVGWMPRVYGYSPGRGSSRAASRPAASSGP